jgi:hypothetical protein
MHHTHTLSVSRAVSQSSVGVCVCKLGCVGGLAGDHGHRWSLVLSTDGLTDVHACFFMFFPMQLHTFRVITIYIIYLVHAKEKK